MAQNLVSIDDLLDIVAKELNVVRPPRANTGEDRSADERTPSPVQSSGNDLCVVDLLEKYFNETYRFRTDDHEVSAGYGRRSFNELVEHWEKRDPDREGDGGTYPETRKAGKWPAKCTVRCTCMECSSGTAVELLCQPYPLRKAGFEGLARGRKGGDYILIHKYKWDGEPWAIILGDMDGFPTEYRPWGSYDDSKPDDIFYSDRVLLRDTYSGSEQPPDAISGKEKRAAQQSIEVDSALEQGYAEEKSEVEGEDESLVGSASGKRKRGTTGTGKKKRRQTHDQYVDDEAFTPTNPVKKARVTGDNQRAPPKPQVSLPSRTKASTGKAHEGSVTEEETPTAPPRRDSARPRPSSKHLTNAPIKDTERRSSTAPALPSVPITRPGSSEEPTAFDLSVAYRSARAHVFQHKSSSGLSILANPAVRDALQTLEAVAKGSDDWLFGQAYEMLDGELASAGVDPLPVLRAER